MNKIISIASGKGGVGKSTVTAFLARELKENGKKVLCVDCDIALRSLDMLFLSDDKVLYDWSDLITGRCPAEKCIIKADVDFIAAPTKPGEKYDKKAFSNAIKSLLPLYDFILLDCPAGIEQGFELAAGACESGIIVATPDPVSLRSANRCVIELMKAGVNDNHLIINMFNKKSVQASKALNIDSCIDLAGAPLTGLIPFDESVTSFVQTHKLPGEFSPFTRAIMRIAKRLLGEKSELRFE